MQPSSPNCAPARTGSEPQRHWLEDKPARMARSTSDTDARLLLWAGWLCVAAALTAQCAASLRPLEFLVDSVFSRDDAFHYFKIARSIAAGHGAKVGIAAPVNSVVVALLKAKEAGFAKA